MYPVDLPAVNGTELTSASKQYLASLESRLPDNEMFQCPSEVESIQVAITENNIKHLQLFEDNQPGSMLLALHHPDDPAQVVAVFLHEEWWCVEDILQTSSKTRSGLLPVESLVDRVIVFLLSQVVERHPEEGSLFSLHPRTESCKLLWRDGQAVGFYTVKHKGSLCYNWSSHGYLLPVLDTVLVRKSWRRRGFGVLMLEDFCSTFQSEEYIGVSTPLSPSMAAVCRKFLLEHAEHRESLYEVEAPGGWTERRNIWLNIKLGRYTPGTNEDSSPLSGDTIANKATVSATENCGRNLKSFSTCDANTPRVAGSAKEHVNCDLSQGGRSQMSGFSGTGCSPNLDSSTPPAEPAGPLNIYQSSLSEPSQYTHPCDEEPGKIDRRAKRAKRT